MVICKCGQPKDDYGEDYRLCRYDSKGDIIWAVCPHGFVVIDTGVEDETIHGHKKT